MIRPFIRMTLKGALARNTLKVIFWQGLRVASQALWLVMVARLLGPNEYGIFAGIAGLGIALGGFVGLGLGLVMYQDVAVQPKRFGERWRQAYVVTAASGMLFAVLFVFFSDWLIGYEEWSVVAGIALSEIIFFPLVTVAAFAFAAHERMGWAAALPAILGGVRVAAVVAFYFFFNNGALATYVWFHAVATLLVAVISVWLVHLLLRPEASTFAIHWQDLREGLGFSTVWVTGNALTSLDKALVLRLAGSEVAGLYTSAYRFAMILALPIDALVMTAMPRLFRDGDGVAANPHLIPKLLLLTLTYGVLAGGGLILLADLIPFFLGERFVSAVHAAKWMGLFLPCYGLRILGGNLLMAKGNKGQRVLIEVGGLASLLLFGFWWLPRFGLNGAVMMVIAVELSLAFAAWSTLVHGWGNRRDRSLMNSPEADWFGE